MFENTVKSIPRHRGREGEGRVMESECIKTSFTNEKLPLFVNLLNTRKLLKSRIRSQWRSSTVVYTKNLLGFCRTLTICFVCYRNFEKNGGSPYSFEQHQQLLCMQQFLKTLT